MIPAIVSKDLSLLRIYVRASVVVTMACYILAIILTWWLTSYHEATMQTGVQRTFLSLTVGSRLGFIATALLGALLAGSAVTLERGDRSVEFLACLPPTRWHNLASKLMVVSAVVTSMIAIHVATTVVASQLLPHVRMDTRTEVPDLNDVMTFLGLIVSTVGGAWGFASCMKSNGAPIVLGMGTPFLTLSLVLFVGWALDVSSEGDSFQLRYNTASILVGGGLGLTGSWLYLTRTEP